MKRHSLYTALFAVVLMQTIGASAQWNVVFLKDECLSLLPVSLIDSIKPSVGNGFDVWLKYDNMKVSTDTLAFTETFNDTIIINYQGDNVSFYNPRLDLYHISIDNASVTLTSKGNRPFVCRISGQSSNGCLVIDADTTMTLVLDNLNLKSQQASAVYLRQKQKVTIELPVSSISTLEDATDYQPADITETANGCLYVRGSLTFVGEGSLVVTGNYRHGIVSSKNITVEDSHLIINNVAKNGIHCDRFTMHSGEVSLTLASDASKGIKAKEEININGGCIEGEATGGISVNEGDISYCSFLKSDGTMNITGGSLTLKHHGDGGRCISVDKGLTISGGILNMECHGDGGSYLTAENDSDYYTPKCITVDDSLHIVGGTVNCLSTGLGGKGIVAGKHIAIGSDDSQDSPIIRVDTKGECIINNVDEDLRFGCPKGIKAGERLCIFGGNIAISTSGMGGEGVESNGTMFVSGGKLECITFDDGINVADNIEIADGQVYCCSADNDGIDSNGSITISGGIIASVNQKKPNESFDAEKGQIYFKGGTIFGIGSGPVDVAEAVYPCYSTPFNESEDGIINRGLILTDGRYVYVQRNDDVVMALHNINLAFRSFVTIMSPFFTEGENLKISEGDRPNDTKQSYFNDKLVLNGKLNNPSLITNIHVQSIK